MIATFFGWFFLLLGLILFGYMLWLRPPRVLTKEQWRRR
jgi:hypothetical protein